MSATLNESARLGAKRGLDLRSDDCLQPMIRESRLLEEPGKNPKYV